MNQKQSRYNETYKPECTTCSKPIESPKDKIYKCAECRSSFIKELYAQGFKKYIHNSGFSAWSKENLCEYSDEWIAEEDIPY